MSIVATSFEVAEVFFGQCEVPVIVRVPVYGV